MASGGTEPKQPQATTPGATPSRPWFLDYYNPATGTGDKRLGTGGGANADADYYHASLLQRYINGEGGLKGDVMAYAGAYNPDVARSAMNALLARSAQRGELNSQIGQLPGLEKQEENLLASDAQQAMGQGIKNTRQNYNQRGLLYSGLRQGGEQQVRTQAASSLASGIASTRRDYQNAADAKRQAIAHLGLASQQESIDRANAIFEMNTKNSIARRQAIEQLGEGVGAVGGRIANYYFGDNPSTTPSTGGYSSDLTPYSGAQPRISGAGF